MRGTEPDATGEFAALLGSVSAPLFTTEEKRLFVERAQAWLVEHPAATHPEKVDAWLAIAYELQAEGRRDTPR